MTTLSLRVFGLPFSVEVPTHRAASLRAQWSWCEPHSPAQRHIAGFPGASPSPLAELERIERPDIVGDDDGHVADYRLTTTLTSRAISARAGTLVMLHAAGLADPRTGRVAALVAPSGTGKTTATQTLCGTGEFGYVTDETLVFNHDGAVMPYPKPLSVLVRESVERHKSQHGPQELGFAMPPCGDLSIGPIIVLNRVTDGSAARLERLSVTEGLQAVLPQSSSMPLIPHCLQFLAEIARQGGGFHRLTYTEISETRGLLHQALDAAPAEQTWTHVEGNWPVGEEAPSRFGHSRDGLATPALGVNTVLRRELFVDAVYLPTEVEALALKGDVPLYLRGVGAHVWQQLATPRPVRDLVQSCVEVFGEHPQAEGLVREALHSLESGGLIVRASSPGAVTGHQATP